MARRQLRHKERKPLIVICVEGEKNSTDNARSTAQSLEQQIIRNKEDLLSSNPHTSIYKILDAIDEFNNLNN